jgi:hypothetical protein
MSSGQRRWADDETIVRERPQALASDAEVTGTLRARTSIPQVPISPELRDRLTCVISAGTLSCLGCTGLHAREYGLRVRDGVGARLGSGIGKASMVVTNDTSLG